MVSGIFSYFYPMLKKINPVILLFLALFFSQAFVFAQTFKFNTQPKGVRLPVQNVLQIEQDTLGQIWFSTTRGVVYSDGIQTIELPDTLVRKFVYQISILKDEDGVIWLYNASGVPAVFEGIKTGWKEEYFEEDLKANFSSKITFHSLGKKKDKYFFLDSGADLLFWKNGEQVKHRVERDYSVTGLLLSAIDLQGKTLLIFQKGAFLLNGFKLDPYQFRGIPLPSLPVLVKKSESGTYYFLGLNYLAKGPGAEFPTEIIDQGFSTSDIVLTPYFSLGFYGEHVFYHYNSHFRRYHPSSNQPIEGDLSFLFRTTYIQTLFVDREGILWLGSARGLANTNNQLFQNTGSESTRFLAEEFSSILEFTPGSFILGFNNGIQLMEDGVVSTLYKDTNPPGSPNRRIVNFSKDASGAIWFAANWAGVGKYDPKSKALNFYAPPKGVNVSSVEVDGDSLLITGPERIFHASLKNLQSGKYGKELTAEIRGLLDIPEIYFRKTARLKNGKIIVIRASRLENQYPIVSTEKYFLAEGYTFLEREGGGILLGTEYGLKIYREGYVGYHIHAGKAVSNPVYALLPDQEGRLWAGTDDGVFVLAEDQLLHYNESNGLVGDEINRGALIKTQDGKVYIGTQKGLSIYSPEEKVAAFGAPKAVIRSAKLGGEVALSEENISVSFSQNSLQIDFITPGFDESRELWIHYRLVNQEDEPWLIIKDPRNSQLFFSNLPFGKYHFELKASYNGEEFSEVVKTPRFEILAPFYFRPSFLIFAVLVLIAIGFLVGQWIRQLQKLGLLQSAVAKESKSKILAEKQFKNVWSSSQDGMIMSLGGKIILTVNPAFARLIGTSVRELENKPVADLFADPDTNLHYISELVNNLKNLPGRGVTFETSVAWKTGTLDMEMYTVLLEEDFNGEALILSVFKDLTAQKAVENRLKEAKEKAEEANRFKSSLLSNLSHEIRTPLNGIIGGTEHVMMTRSTDPELMDQLDIILQSGERLLDTINSLLDLAKIEANKMPINYSETWVYAFFSLVLRPMEALADRKGLRLNRSFQGEDFLALVDRRFLEMILNNLISNAIKYSEEGEILVEVYQEEGLLVMQVTDSGVGMTEEFQEKMFDPFEQESQGHERLFEGTGLGLNITKNLVLLLGGEIQVWSAKNQGTRIRVEIPLPQL